MEICLCGQSCDKYGSSLDFFSVGLVRLSVGILNATAPTVGRNFQLQNSVDVHLTIGLSCVKHQRIRHLFFGLGIKDHTE